jgi:hypothetical protein
LRGHAAEIDFGQQLPVRRPLAPAKRRGPDELTGRASGIAGGPGLKVILGKCDAVFVPVVGPPVIIVVGEDGPQDLAQVRA